MFEYNTIVHFNCINQNTKTQKVLTVWNTLVRRANIVVVYVDGVEPVAVQDEGFARARSA